MSESVLKKSRARARDMSTKSDYEIMYGITKHAIDRRINGLRALNAEIGRVYGVS